MADIAAASLLHNASSSFSSSLHPHHQGTEWLNILSTVCGWTYFVAWSLSFYPQVWDNFRRKSVVGLSFDFLAINLSGYISYSTYNCLFMWDHTIHHQYFHKNPTATAVPVKLNDVVFALHGLLLTSITALQCFFFERKAQRVHPLVIVATILVWSSAGIQALIVLFAHKLSWLYMLYYLSYIKLLVTCTKYAPQAFMNWKRKCTTGWSIGNVLLDFSGGLLSLFQVIIDGINLGNWMDFWGNPVKVGLSFITLFFDTIFIIQHYILYRGNTLPPEYKSLLDEESGVPSDSETARNLAAYLSSPDPPPFSRPAKNTTLWNPRIQAK